MHIKEIVKVQKVFSDFNQELIVSSNVKKGH